MIVRLDLKCIAGMEFGRVCVWCCQIVRKKCQKRSHTNWTWIYRGRACSLNTRMGVHFRYFHVNWHFCLVPTQYVLYMFLIYCYYSRMIWLDLPFPSIRLCFADRRFPRFVSSFLAHSFARFCVCPPSPQSTVAYFTVTDSLALLRWFLFFSFD